MTTPAQTCADNGWTIGTHITRVTDEADGVVFDITAVGRELVLARQVSPGDHSQEPGPESALTVDPGTWRYVSGPLIKHLPVLRGFGPVDTAAYWLDSLQKEVQRHGYDCDCQAGGPDAASIDKDYLDSALAAVRRGFDAMHGLRDADLAGDALGDRFRVLWRHVTTENAELRDRVSRLEYEKSIFDRLFVLDLEADAAYIHLTANEVANTQVFADQVVVDLDDQGCPVGVEILGVQQALRNMRRTAGEAGDET
jgi:uncharacterized protein YuzE